MDKFKFLVDMISYDNDFENTLRDKIQKGMETYRKIYPLCDHMKKQTRKQILKVSGILMLTYGAQSWFLEESITQTKLSGLSRFVKNSLTKAKKIRAPMNSRSLQEKTKKIRLKIKTDEPYG